MRKSQKKSGQGPILSKGTAESLTLLLQTVCTPKSMPFANYPLRLTQAPILRKLLKLHKSSKSSEARDRCRLTQASKPIYRLLASVSVSLATSAGLRAFAAPVPGRRFRDSLFCRKLDSRARSAQGTPNQIGSRAFFLSCGLTRARRGAPRQRTHRVWRGSE